MKHLHIAVLAGVMVLLVTLGTQSVAQTGLGNKLFKADLTGNEEPPAVSSTGSGEFKAIVSPDETSLDYQISYANLEGEVRQAHIHFGQKGVNGGISIWLCETATNPSPSASTPACTNPMDPLDTHSGMATGTVTALEVIGPAGQGIAAGEFAEILNAIRQGLAYANVHSSRNPGGEVRGQIRKGDKGKDKDK
jgi:hypothetical protein